MRLKGLHPLQNVIVHPFPIQLIYRIFIQLQTKGKTLLAISAEIVFEKTLTIFVTLSLLNNYTADKATIYALLTTFKQSASYGVRFFYLFALFFYLV